MLLEESAYLVQETELFFCFPVQDFDLEEQRNNFSLVNICMAQTQLVF